MEEVSMTETAVRIDPAEVEAFAGKTVEMLNNAFLTLLVSVGHETGLFDTMAALGRPGTSVEIAESAGLQERYVREWLGGVTVGRIVRYYPDSATYELPAAHAASLTRAAGPDNLAVMAAYLSLAGEVEPRLVECFRNGGGVPYSMYPRFQALMAQESGAVLDATLIERTLPMVPGLVARLDAGIDVADIGTGSGHAINLMAKAFPNSRFVGYDISEKGIAQARREAEAMGLANARFELKDVASLDGTTKFDFITAFGAIHDQAQPRRVLKGIADSLREGGIFLMVDIAASSNLEENLDHPLAPLLYAVSTFHCMTVSLAEGGEGLGTVWGEQKARELLAEAGFRNVEVTRVEGDITNNYYIVTK
jgi:SAM-dependent methyltransferase